MSVLREMLLYLLPRLVPILFWGSLGFYILYRRNHPVKRQKWERIVGRVLLVLFLILVLCGGVVILMSMWRFTNRSKVIFANQNARNVRNAFCATVQTLDVQGKLPAQCPELYTGQFGAEAEDDPLLEGMTAYLDNSYRGQYFVVVTDENWQVEYVLWSRKPIEPLEIHPYTETEQREFANRLFVSHSELVGYAPGD